MSWLKRLSWQDPDDERRCEAEPTFETLPAIDLAKPPCTNFSSPLDGIWQEDADIMRRVDFLECPVMSSVIACRWLGLAHADAAARLRFSPTLCHLRPFCAYSLLKKLAGRKVVVFGDSHGRQVFISLVCKLFKAGVVSTIMGACKGASCIAHGQYATDGKVCGPRHCNFEKGAPSQALQGGASSGTDVTLVGGGSLHLREAKYEFDAMPSFYTTRLPPVATALNLSASDILVVSDGAAHLTHATRELRAAAASLVSYSRRLDSPQVVWVDYMAPHFHHGGTSFRHPGGEFGREALSCVGPAAPLAASNISTPCSPHSCDSRGVGNLAALLILQEAGIPIVHSFHATRQVHISHSGTRMINHTRSRGVPDCHHVCSSSGPEELRTTLLVNLLLSNLGASSVPSSSADEDPLVKAQEFLRSYNTGPKGRPRPPNLLPQPCYGNQGPDLCGAIRTTKARRACALQRALNCTRHIPTKPP